MPALSSSSLSRASLPARLHSIAIRLLRRLRREDRTSGVGPARLSALSVLVFGGSRTLGELAAEEQVRPPTMTAVVRGLERAGLAERRADPSDGRVARVRATRTGRRLLARARKRRLDTLRTLLDNASAADRALLTRAAVILETLLRSR